MIPNLLVLPNLDYRYFRDSESFPFQPRAEEFSLVNAAWLADAALLAYASEGRARQVFGPVGLKETRFFSREGTQCHVAAGASHVIVAFRGTDFDLRSRDGSAFKNFRRDLVQDVKIKLVKEKGAGQVHDGVQEALDEIWDDLRDHLRDLTTDERTLWLTGHSLGGALATLAAVRLDNVHGLYTYGSLRVGDRDFVRALRVPTYRFVHQYDFVTELPPRRLGYRHVGALKYITWGGREILDGTGSRNFLWDLVRIRYRPLTQHAPLHYCEALWKHATAGRPRAGAD